MRAAKGNGGWIDAHGTHYWDDGVESDDPTRCAQGGHEI